MASSTRQSLAKAQGLVGPKLEKADLKLVSQLFAIADAIASSSQLRNLLADPSAELKAKSGAVSAVFAKSTSADAIEIVTALVALRWSKGSDLVLALEQLAVQAVASIAAKNKTIEQVENELFTFNQAIHENSELQFALASNQATAEAKLKLVNSLIKSASTEGQELIRQAVVSARKVRLSLVLDKFGKWVSAYASRLIATVTVAAPLDAKSQERLQKALSKAYNAEIKLNIQIDATIIGGIKVQIDGEIIDGSLSSRLNQARLQLA